MNVTALIAEDEGPQRRALARLLSNAWPELRIVAECANGTSALAALQAERPTIAFLDIRMAGKDGITVAQQAGSSTQIVFTTARFSFSEWHCGRRTSSASPATCVGSPAPRTSR